MTHVTCGLTAKNRDHLRNPMLGNRVWATFLMSSSTFFTSVPCIESWPRITQAADFIAGSCRSTLCQRLIDTNNRVLCVRRKPVFTRPDHVESRCRERVNFGQLLPGLTSRNSLYTQRERLWMNRIEFHTLPPAQTPKLALRYRLRKLITSCDMSPAWKLSRQTQA